MIIIIMVFMHDWQIKDDMLLNKFAWMHNGSWFNLFKEFELLGLPQYNWQLMKLLLVLTYPYSLFMKPNKV